MRRKKKTPFGTWAKAQPRGVISRCARATGLAFSTVQYAQTRLVTVEVAELLSAFSGGEVAVDDIRIPSRIAS